MSKLKGWFGERITQFGLWFFLDQAKYKRLHNLIIDINNITTQIDHIYLSRYGIFVLETKYYDGWIFGDEKDQQWTQMFPNRKKYKFQNPLLQNYRHTKALSDMLGIDSEHIHSIIVFVGKDAKIKTPMPPNVVIKPYQAALYIKTFDRTVFSYAELRQIENDLNNARKIQVSEQAHVYNLKQRYEQTDSCPKCGSAMVEKAASKGKNKGETFMACSAYPKCKYIQDTQGESEPQRVSEQEHVYNLKQRDEQTDSCPKCGSAMVEKVRSRGKNKGETFMACSAYPKCKYIQDTQGESEQEHIDNLKQHDEQTDNCPKCGSAMVEKTASRGKNKGETFMACSAYPKCRYIQEKERAPSAL